MLTITLHLTTLKPQVCDANHHATPNDFEATDLQRQPSRCTSRLNQKMQTPSDLHLHREAHQPPSHNLQKECPKHHNRLRLRWETTERRTTH